VAKTLEQMRDEILTKLGDQDNVVWSDSDIEAYIAEGWDDLCIQTKLNWKSTTIDDVAAQATYDLPADFYEVDRVTWNDFRCAPVRARELRDLDQYYMSQTGDVIAYSLDMDGIGKIRKYRIPPSDAGHYAVTGSWGTPRSLSDVDSAAPVGSWGIARRISPVIGSTPDQAWGIPRSPIPNMASAQFKLEYYGRGPDLTVSGSTFGAPDYLIRCVRHYGLYRAFDREGDGQDIQLSEMFHKLYLAGVERAKVRLSNVRRMRRTVMGGAGQKSTVLGRPQLKDPFYEPIVTV
jgi:hypothetical protein